MGRPLLDRLIAMQCEYVDLNIWQLLKLKMDTGNRYVDVFGAIAILCVVFGGLWLLGRHFGGSLAALWGRPSTN
jgi:hypothetical protein